MATGVVSKIILLNCKNDETIFIDGLDTGVIKSRTVRIDIILCG